MKGHRPVSPYRDALPVVPPRPTWRDAIAANRDGAALILGVVMLAGLVIPWVVACYAVAVLAMVRGHSPLALGAVFAAIAMAHPIRIATRAARWSMAARIVDRLTRNCDPRPMTCDVCGKPAVLGCEGCDLACCIGCEDAADHAGNPARYPLDRIVKPWHRRKPRP
mgnify:CR=1 FL=1